MTQQFNQPNLRGRFDVAVSLVGSERLMLQSISTYSTGGAGTLHDTVEVYFDRKRENSFTIFAWMTDVEGNVFWLTGDTVWGRIHSNGAMHMDGRPVFMKKVTTSKGIDPRPGTGTNRAIFKDSYETGVAQVPLPTDINEMIAASQESGGKHYTTDIWVTLSGGDGSTSGDGIAYIQTVAGGPVVDSVMISDPNFNGVILTTGNATVKGKLDGALSIGAVNDIHVVDDIRYEQDPRQYPNSNDMLGLISGHDVVVDNIPETYNCHIDGSIFALNKFRAEGYNSRPPAGDLVVFGSIVQKERGEICTFQSGRTPKTGFSKAYTYDERLSNPLHKPPSYPGYYVKTLAITNWWESYRVVQYR